MQGDGEVRVQFDEALAVVKNEDIFFWVLVIQVYALPNHSISHILSQLNIGII